jgi:predicted DNA-binding protein with PD1-like motif
MLFAKESNLLAIKLDDGENLLSGLEQAFNQNMIKSAVIVGGIGMVIGFKLGYYNGKEYVSKEFNEPHELLSLQGNVSQMDGGKLMLHLHASVSASDNTMFGGHLLSASVKNMAEIFAIRLVDIELKRRRSEKSGLNELEFHKASETKLSHGTKHRSGSMELDSD